MTTRRGPIFVSDLLAGRYPAVAGTLGDVLGDRLRLIPGTKDVWCRDYMPVPAGHGRLVQFRYDPDYLKEEPDLRTEGGAHLLGLADRCRCSDLVIDGGNVVRHGSTAMLTDKVYRDNPGHERPRLRESLRELLEVERLVIIPREPYEPLGHADGVLYLVDERTVLVNDYASADSTYGRRLGEVLIREGFDMVPIPYCPSLKRTGDGLCSADGVYVNFLDAGDAVLCPEYGRPEDDVAVRLLERVFAGRRVVQVRSGELAAAGGVLNCVTWTPETK